uniref:Gag-Pol polyprotein n=1 Tax=Tanacetum cinerariifolium TaxID=118510 RepID=A0A6L2L705_TANCI|nr:Gag-Pol polyprotein [Tanacetum cinerariifolium]
MSTQQDIYAAGSESRPPMLNKENYVPWSSRQPGDANREVTVTETFHLQTDDELSEKELKQIEADDQAIQTILLGLSEDIYAAVDSCETAQEIWLRIQQMMKGSNIGIQEKKAKLFNEWEMFTSNEGESIESYYHRFLKLMNNLKRNKHFPEKIVSNLKFLNNLQPEWSRHVTIVHQTKDLHTAGYTKLYDFLKYNQKEVDELKAERLAKTQGPLALMTNSNNPYAFPAPHQEQSSFNQNYLQQPMPNLEDITDPTTAMNMALTLMAKAFKLNYSTLTNNNQRISSNPRNRQIAQPGMNMGQDRQIQMVEGNGGNQFRQYVGNPAGYNDVIGNQNQIGNGNLVAARAEGNAAGQNGNQIRCYNCRGVDHYARNCTVRPRRRDAAYLQIQLLITQKEEAGIQLQAKEYDLMAAAADLDDIEEVNANCILMANLQQASTMGTQTDSAPVYDSDGSTEVHENCDDNEIFNMFTQEEQYTELLEPIPESHQVPHNDNDVISDDTSVEQGRKTVEQHPANFEETRALYESLYQNLAIEVEKVNSVNRKLKETNADLTTELARFKNQTRCFEISQEKYDKLERCYQQSFYQEQCLSKKINALHLSTEETLQLAQESREKMKQLNKEIKPANYTKINHLSGVFVLQTAMSREELYISNISKTANVSKSISIPNTDFSDDTTPSVARKFLNEVQSTIVTLQRVIKQRMTIETHNWSSSAHQELHKIVRDEIFPIVNQVDARLQNFKIQFLKEAAKFVGDFKSLANEADASLAKHKALELEIKRLLKAVVSQDIMIIVQNKSVVDTSDLQTELERTKERFENCIIKKETEYAKLWNDWYKRCDECKYDNISYDKAYKDMQQQIEWLQAQLGDLKGVDNTKTRRPQPRRNTKHDRVPSSSKSSRSKNKEAEVEEPHRNLLLSKNNKHISPAWNNIKIDPQDVISKKQKAKVSFKENQRKYQPKVTKPKKVGTRESLATPKLRQSRLLLRWSPTGRLFDQEGKIVDSSKSESQFDCSNGDNKFMGTVRFENDHVDAILGFDDLQWGNILITRVYFVEGLGHNLFSVGQFCDSDLAVAFRRSACFVRNLEGVDLSKGDRSTNLYTINLHEMASASPIYLMARASSTKSWLWHQRLSHLNFDTINDLARNDLVAGLPKFKYHKEHLCPSCEQGKSKRASHPPKPVPNSRQRLHLLHMDLCRPMRIASINGKLTPQQNGVVDRRNRTLVEAARTMLIFSYAPLFLWAEAIATACFTQNCSIIHHRFNKTPYELINGRKPNISFLHVFSALCYPKNDRENIGKLGAKGDIGFFIGYSTDSCAYRIYNRRTKNIIETMNVSFNELSVMAFEQRSSKPGLQSMTSGQISSRLDLNYAPSTITTQQPSEGELDLFSKAMYDDYIGGQPSATGGTVPPAQEPQVRQTSTASTTIANTTPIPTNSSSHAANIPITSQDVDELNSNDMANGNTFFNPFANSSTSAAASSSLQNVDPSNMHMFYQPYPQEFQWTKDHPLEQVIGEPLRLVLIRNQLQSDGDMCMYALSVSIMEPKNVKEALTDPAWIDSIEKLVSWSSKKQDCTALSTAEAEYVSLSACCAQVLWIRTQLTDYGFHFNKILIYCDSKSAIAISCHPVQHSRTKHIAVCYHFIKEHVEKGTIELYFVKTDCQLADIFTKALPADRFNYLVRRLGISSLSPKELERLAKSQ